MKERRSEIVRETRETRVELTLCIDGVGDADVATGIGFLDHLLTTLTCHARFDLHLVCRGDTDVDDHHTAEDCALALGAALDQCLGDRSGIARFGHAYAPLDEALARAVVDLSGRPFPRIDLRLRRERLGDLSCENISHVLASLAVAGRMALHVDVIDGLNDHHKAEAAFKATALALRQSVSRLGEGVPSTKGLL
ncbi:MAG: imidazoleglycerol-phosphate dehydratase HisB [Fimbriimonadia bacterium]|jgi:imidazoleglycerol phosphate dehydratase HisB